MELRTTSPAGQELESHGARKLGAIIRTSNRVKLREFRLNENQFPEPGSWRGQTDGLREDLDRFVQLSRSVVVNPQSLADSKESLVFQRTGFSEKRFQGADPFRVIPRQSVDIADSLQ